MMDKRFEARLKRIDARQKKGGGVELLAGVGDVREAKESAVQATPQQTSGAVILLGGGIGLAAVSTLSQLVGFDQMRALPPGMLIEIGLNEPMIGGAAAMLAICAFLAAWGVARGKRGRHLMSFGGAAMISAFGSAALAMA